MGTAVRGEQRFLQPGDVIEATHRRDRHAHDFGGRRGRAAGRDGGTAAPGEFLPAKLSQ